MTMRLLLICSAPPIAPHFPGDDPALPRFLDRLAKLTLPTDGLYLSSTLQRAAQTCRALGLHPQIEPALDEVDFGGWKGRDPQEVLVEDAAGFAGWISDPSVAPPEGESFAAMAARVQAFLERLAQDAQGKTVIAVTHPGPIQAAVLGVLGAPLTSASKVSVAPGGQTRLSHDGRRWSLSVGAEL